jgi:hypothetical protein
MIEKHGAMNLYSCHCDYIVDSQDQYEVALNPNERKWALSVENIGASPVRKIY